MLDQPTIVNTEAQPAAVIHLTIPREAIQTEMGPAIQELFAALGAQGISPIGPLFSHHFRMDPEEFDFEVGLPIDAGVKATGRVKVGELPATSAVARTVYTGPYEELGAAWGEFGDWISSQGYEAAPDLWECYIAGPESVDDAANFRTELNRPLVTP